MLPIKIEEFAFLTTPLHFGKLPQFSYCLFFHNMFKMFLHISCPDRIVRNVLAKFYSLRTYPCKLFLGQFGLRENQIVNIALRIFIKLANYLCLSWHIGAKLCRVKKRLKRINTKLGFLFLFFSLF